MLKLPFFDATSILVAILQIAYQYQKTEAVLWLARPDNFTYGPQGSNIRMRWNYKMENKDKFLSSIIHYNGGDIASLHAGESNYAKYQLANFNIPFNISGSDDVTLTIYNAETSYNGKFCCEVDYRRSDAGKLKTQECTELFTYVLPHITYLTPDISGKQGDQVKLECKASGYPSPRGEWIYKEPNKTIANSFVTSINISSKQSEGILCCQATNQFGNQKNCTSVEVTEYQPIRTTLKSKTPYVTKYREFELQCNAKANPLPYYIFMQNNVHIYNSTDGRYVSNNITDDIGIEISCQPWNKYGYGPREYITLSVGDPPRFTSDLRTSYNMTTENINITCIATGTPKPNITWTKEESEEIISTKEYYEISFDECANETLIFYCHARNMAGAIRSPRIQVQRDQAVGASCFGSRPTISPYYNPPRFSSDLRTSYNMTTKSINITCRATGNPKPNITWTKDDSDEIIGTKEYYEVPYIKYDKNTLKFYCHASNFLGTVKSSEIQVNVMMKAYPAQYVKYCKVASTRLDSKLAIIVAVPVTVLFLVIVVIFSLIKFFRKKTTRLEEIEESLYGEPIDAIPITVSGKVGDVVPKREEDYAAIEEVASDDTPTEQHTDKEDEEPIYAAIKKPSKKQT